MKNTKTAFGWKVFWVLTVVMATAMQTAWAAKQPPHERCGEFKAVGISRFTQNGALIFKISPETQSEITVKPTEGTPIADVIDRSIYAFSVEIDKRSPYRLEGPVRSLRKMTIAEYKKFLKQHPSGLQLVKPASCGR